MFLLFFFNNTPTTEIYTLSLHDALPIYLVIKAVTSRAIERARDELAVRRPRVEPACLRQKALAARPFELAPELPRAAQQWLVVGMLVIGEPNDPGEATRRAERVAARETINAQHRRAARRERVSSRATVRAEPGDDDVRVHRRMVTHLCRVHRPV